MLYLGRLSGDGTVLFVGFTVGRVHYEFDGYSTQHSGVTCSGQIETSAAVLRSLFSFRILDLATDAGRKLEIRFSDNTLGPTQVAARVDVRGEIPGDNKREWIRCRGAHQTGTDAATAASAFAGNQGRGSKTFYSSL
jgi:hypothetical protein